MLLFCKGRLRNVQRLITHVLKLPVVTEQKHGNVESIYLSELIAHTTDAAVTEMTICDLLSEKVVLFVRSIDRLFGR